MPGGYEQLPPEAPDLDYRFAEFSPVPPYPPNFGSSASSSISPPTGKNPFSYPQAPRKTSLGASRKGKGRAVEPVEASQGEVGGGESTGPAGLSFCVRFTDGQTEDVLDLWVGEKEPVREVKRRIRLLRPKTLYTSEEDGSKPRRLRFILLGRLLPDGVFLVPYTSQLNSRRAALVSSSTEDKSAVKEGIEAVGRGIGAVVREVTKGKEKEMDEVDAMERGEASSGKGKGKEKEAPPVEDEEQIWLHCSVGEAEEEETEKKADGEKEKEQTSQITPLQGFDRLRDAGFSDADIENLRAEFRERRGIDEEDEEDDAEHQRALEEQWMSGMTGQEEAGADGSTSGHYYSLLKGVCVGFFVPFLPVFFFRSQVFTKRMQMAITLGIAMNLVFGLLRLLG
ncbi:hypothetical protein JCM8547_007807 [Rhodosporidiobolus lusitaniae]